MAYPKLERAIEFALRAHAGHYRSGESALPYIFHPIDVVSKLWRLGGIRNEDVLAAGVLHDVLEDTLTTPEELAREFGPHTARWVGQLTRRRPGETEIADSGGTRRELEFALLLEDLRQMEPEAQAVKLSDRLSNLSESETTREREVTQRYAREALEMLKIVGPDLVPGLRRELETLARRLATES